MDPEATVVELWQRLQARDWEGFAALLAEGLVIEWPNSRQRFRDRDAFVEFNQEYPEGWAIEVLNIYAADHVVVSEVRVPHETLGRFDLIAIYEVENGRVVRGREYWMDEVSEPVSPEREPWLEPM